jgi:hypothetical protein
MSNYACNDPTAVTVADGADVALGTTTDAAKTDSTLAGTVISFLKGIVKILASVWDSVNGRLMVDGSGVTQPVSITAALATTANLANETGGNLAAIAADTADMETSLASIDTKFTNPLPVSLAAGAAVTAAATATAIPPAYVEGAASALSEDLTGNLRVSDYVLAVQLRKLDELIDLMRQVVAAQLFTVNTLDRRANLTQEDLTLN